jgi:hypothetical protein
MEKEERSLTRGGNQAELIACASAKGFPRETASFALNRPKQPSAKAQRAVTHCHAKACLKLSGPNLPFHTASTTVNSHTMMAARSSLDVHFTPHG